MKHYFNFCILGAIINALLMVIALSSDDVWLKEMMIGLQLTVILAMGFCVAKLLGAYRDK